MRETTETAVHASPAAGTDDWSRHLRGILVATLAAPVMAVLAPVGTDAIGFWPRLAYWLILMESGALLGIGVTSGVERWGRLRRLPVLEVSLVALVIALPLTLIVASASGIFFGVRIHGVRTLLTMFGIVLLITASLTAINYALHRPKAGQSPAPAVPAPEPLARFAARLPLPQRNLAVLALEAEDHYLRVHLEGGQSALILMRLSDAIAELGTVPGARTHRSWWVAKAAVMRIARLDGRAVLTLAGGLEAPVSRSHYRTLKDAGWLVG